VLRARRPQARRGRAALLRISAGGVCSSDAGARGRRIRTDAQGFLYGRVTTRSGDVYLGRLRWAGNREAFWGDSFNGLKAENPWAAQVPPERLPKEDRSVSILGVHFGDSAHPHGLRRRFMARFGDLARIEARGTKLVRVTLKSGNAFDLDRLEAGDFDDGVRVFDARGTVDLDSRVIASVELLPTTGLTDAPARLSGTVHTAQGDFTGTCSGTARRASRPTSSSAAGRSASPASGRRSSPALGRSAPSVCASTPSVGSRAGTRTARW
jgi:hypothetical protein